MEVREGYKNTEIGVIPENWEVKRIIDISPLQRGFDLPNKNLQKGIYPVVYSNGILNYHNKSQAKAPGIVTGRSGTIGKVTFVEQDYWPHNTALWVTDFKNNVPKYIYYLYLNIKLERFATGSGVPTLNRNDVHNYKIAIPKSKEEQKAIAEVLSDTDNLIQALEKRIAKKRVIKQGATQKLLTPKGDWEVKKLKEIGKTYGGLSGKSKKDFDNGKYPYIPFMNIMSNPVIDTTYLDYVNIEIGESQNQALKDDLFFNGSSETPGEVGMCSILLKDIPNLYLNSFCFGFRLKKELKTDGLYLSYFFRSNEGRKVFYSMAQGATRYNLSKSNFLEIEIVLPPLEEQNRIATILSDMDSEIETLEKKLAKYKELKQGLMQNLLTGNMRLI